MGVLSGALAEAVAKVAAGLNPKVQQPGCKALKEVISVKNSPLKAEEWLAQLAWVQRKEGFQRFYQAGAVSRSCQYNINAFVSSIRLATLKRKPSVVSYKAYVTSCKLYSGEGLVVLPISRIIGKLSYSYKAGKGDLAGGREVNIVD